jgi:Na+/H+ antiporter NhaD/arsenite permease-like protein
VTAGCTNLVIAANAGGAFSPFGDITTLMVWQEHKAATLDFLRLFPASLVNWLVPALCMHAALPKGRPDPVQGDTRLKPGALALCLLFAATIATAIVFHAALELPPFLGMTTASATTWSGAGGSSVV